MKKRRRLIPVNTKLIECDKCGQVSRISENAPLKLSWCGSCRSSRIRLHRGCGYCGERVTPKTGNRKMGGYFWHSLCWKTFLIIQNN